MKNIDASNFENVLVQVRRNAPAVGLAALAGRTSNRALKQAHKILSDANIELTRGPMNYTWRSLKKANPRLSHSIEEVLVFGDALFTAIGQKQSPESLKADFLEVKQRFAKIVKETEVLALPKEEKSLFSFFDKNSKKPEEKTELRLEALDKLLEEAHDHSRDLLQKTEKDLLAERSFHRAVDWFILALEDAQQRLQKAEQDGLDMPADEFIELSNALGAARITTEANMAVSDRFLRVKEDLHNKSISFLTAHENTFTVIQGHLRSWKDIKTQTDALNALSDTVKAGAALMSNASIGMETAVMQPWDGELISKETLSVLSNSFGDYDKNITQLVSNLNAAANDSQIQPSHWDQWDKTKESIINVVRDNAENGGASSTSSYRPALRKTADKQSSALVSEFIYDEGVEQPEVSPQPIKQFEFAKKESWTVMDKLAVSKKLAAYAKAVGLTLAAQDAQDLKWTASSTIARVSAPLLKVGENALAAAPLVLRSQVDYVVRHGNPFTADWSKILEQNVLVSTQNNWDEQFQSWMSSKDDLEWAYLMQWNDLVYDLLIMDQDKEEKHAILSGASEHYQKVRESLVERITEFAQAPGVSEKDLKEWGLNGLIIRYAVALDMDTATVDKLWGLWHNPKQPIDWNEDLVSTWNEKYPEDMATAAGERIVSQILEGPASELNANFVGSRILSRRDESLKDGLEASSNKSKKARLL